MTEKYNLSLISSISSYLFEKTVYRVVLETFKDKVISTEGNRFYQGRYHFLGETGILYLSLTKDIAIKEIERHASRNMLREKLVLASIDIRLHKTIDLTKISSLQKLGLTKENLIASDYSITQAISIAARQEELQGLIVPSAASEGDNLIIFENNLSKGCLIEIKDICIL